MASGLLSPRFACHARQFLSTWPWEPASIEWLISFATFAWLNGRGMGRNLHLMSMSPNVDCLKRPHISYCSASGTLSISNTLYLSPDQFTWVSSEFHDGWPEGKIEQLTCQNKVPAKLKHFWIVRHCWLWSLFDLTFTSEYLNFDESLHWTHNWDLNQIAFSRRAKNESGTVERMKLGQSLFALKNCAGSCILRCLRLLEAA